MAAIPNYNILRVIGSGCFGNCLLKLGFVFEAENRKNQKRVALKRIEKVGNQLSREYEILHMIKNCPNVVQIQVKSQQSLGLFLLQK